MDYNRSANTRRGTEENNRNKTWRKETAKNKSNESTNKKIKIFAIKITANFYYDSACISALFTKCN